MVGAGQGGQVAESIETFYFPGPTAAMHPSFLLCELSGLLQESTWKVEYNKPLPTWDNYAYDLSAGAAFKTAPHPQVAVILHPKLQPAIRDHCEGM